MGYAAHAVRHMTTYEYCAPHGLNHGLAILHEEMSDYLVPPMLEDAAVLLGDFMAMTEALSACCMQIRAHEKQSAHSHQEARNAAYLRAEEEARLKRELTETRAKLRQAEEEWDDAVSQLGEVRGGRRDLQARLSAVAGELRVTKGAVQQLEADLAEARRLQTAIPLAPIETPAEPHVTHSQVLATSISRMTLGAAQPPAPTAPIMQTVLLPVETTSVRVTGARAIAQLADHAWKVGLPPTSGIHMPREHRKSEPVPLSVPYLCAIATAWLPSPPPGYHVEDLPYPAARESGRQPELHAIPVQQDPVRFQPISANVGQPELVLAPPAPVPVEPAHAPADPAQRELMEEAAAFPATKGPVCAVYPLPKPQRR